MTNETNGRDGLIFRNAPKLRRGLRLLLTQVCCAALLIGTAPAPLGAQTPVAAVSSDAAGFTVEQLDALLAPIALYPDALLTQVLMASTFPLQIVEAGRWLDDPANKALTGDALTRALAQKNWDPSVKSLVPFPQIWTMMNSQLDWMQQLGYAMTVQQNADVWTACSGCAGRRRRPGSCRRTTQQVVSTEGQTIVIEPAQPNVVYVPAYNPTVVYGAWPYPAYPPVYLPPPPGYYVGSALVAGLAFGAGVAITAGLWGWARPNWGGGYVNVNVNRYNNINVNRPPIHNGNWNGNWHGGGGGYRPGGGGYRPPTGPVGLPGRPGGYPANGIGRPNVSVPGGVVRPPGGIGQGNRPPINHGGANRPGGGPGAGQPGRPGGGPGAGQPGRPGGGPGAGQPGRPGGGPGAGQPGRPGGGPGAGQPGRPGGGQGAGQPGRPGGGQGAGRPGGGQGAGQPGRPGGGRGLGRMRARAAGAAPRRSADRAREGRPRSTGNRGAQSRQSAAPQRGGGSRGGGGGARGGGGQHRR